MVKTLQFHRRRFVQVTYLVREPRSHMPCGQKIKSSKISVRIRSSGEATGGPRSTFCVGGLVVGGKELRAVAQTWLPVVIAHLCWPVITSAIWESFLPNEIRVLIVIIFKPVSYTKHKMRKHETYI